MLFRLAPHVHVNRENILCFCSIKIDCICSRLMNIMYYDQREDAKAQAAGGISIGPFLITPEQVGSLIR